MYNRVNMYIKSKKFSLLILGVTAIILSKIVFYIFNDPEGPNLLIVAGLAGILYIISLVAYLFNFSSQKKLLLAIFIQILVATIIYSFM